MRIFRFFRLTLPLVLLASCTEPVEVDSAYGGGSSRLYDMFEDALDQAEACQAKNNVFCVESIFRTVAVGFRLNGFPKAGSMLGHYLGGSGNDYELNGLDGMVQDAFDMGVMGYTSGDTASSFDSHVSAYSWAELLDPFLAEALGWPSTSAMTHEVYLPDLPLSAVNVGVEWSDLGMSLHRFGASCTATVRVTDSFGNKQAWLQRLECDAWDTYDYHPDRFDGENRHHNLLAWLQEKGAAKKFFVSAHFEIPAGQQLFQ